MEKYETLEPVQLNSHVLGFFDRNDSDDVMQGLLALDTPEEDVIIVPASEAAQVVDVSGEDSGPLIWAERLLQRVIGGGPAELMRDVQMPYDKDTFFVCVRVRNEEQKDIVAGIMKCHHGQKVKFINRYYVENITVEPDHDQMSNVDVRPVGPS